MANPARPRPVGARGSPRELRRWIGRDGRALVALSGGVDSAVVAALTHAALPGRSVAVTLAGVAVASREVERARQVATAIGIEHVVLPVDPLAVAGYRENPADRCYFCRSTESTTFHRWGAAHGIAQYLDGVQVDDLGDDRPGIRAMDEAGFRHPLVAGGWHKADVRRYARRRGLPNADQPSDACLASRIPHGQPVTAELLARVESAEAWMEQQGFRRVRVRVRGGAARVEVDPDEVPRLTGGAMAATVTTELQRRGFDAVVLDPVGYRPRAGA
ncbi:MAG: ATP-dependent sacrificial sulfur transferase LarE [Thermoplasmata archaeon]|nr:ATP-dependent sacrificial sulfur transferase LarE [Thermoplasmata archaeon]